MSQDRKRPTLTRDSVLAAGVALADEIGLADFTIRKLAASLGVGTMTIYHHVPSKEGIIGGMVEIVFGEIQLPSQDEDWKTAIRARCVSVREVLNRHPWAAPLMESGTSPGPNSLRHHDAVLETLRNGGLSIELTAHAYAILDSFVYGFAFEEAMLPATGGDGLAEVAEEMASHMVFEDYPYLAELTVEHVLKPGYNFGDSFEFGLDLIIEGLDRASNES
ncbi:MAG: TetR/AcrR family transcriptional regulator [Armatimonadetes bacterium]|nr:MAG: TetR/AcrR family transcriptional regulator [Armatimonadota bacterium]